MCEQMGKPLGIYSDIDPCTVCIRNVAGRSVADCKYLEFIPTREYKKKGKKLFEATH